MLTDGNINEQKLKKIENDLISVDQKITDDEQKLMTINKSLTLNTDELSDFEEELVKISKLYATRLSKFYADLELVKHEVQRLQTNFEKGSEIINYHSENFKNKLHEIEQKIVHVEMKCENCDKQLDLINEKLGYETDERKKLKQELEYMISTKCDALEKDFEQFKLEQTMKASRDVFNDIKDHVEQLIFTIMRKREGFLDQKEEQYRGFLTQEINKELVKIKEDNVTENENLFNIIQQLDQEVDKKILDVDEFNKKRLDDLKLHFEKKFKDLDDRITETFNKNKLVSFNN
jgi:hypothetical protein